MWRLCTVAPLLSAKTFGFSRRGALVAAMGEQLGLIATLPRNGAGYGPGCWEGGKGHGADETRVGICGLPPFNQRTIEGWGTQLRCSLKGGPPAAFCEMEI
jgi:hypothetical protein